MSTSLCADKIIDFMAKKVDESDNAIGLRMSDVLRDRLLERRNGEIVRLMRLLLCTKPKDLALAYPSKAELQQKA